ncbi:NAD-dependent succinate-semialdehyde dehydrogenase [Sphingomonas baiyangensis]|uniref:NAD-dependent succinate-semialdehyde dehydrogenase n=1 Tax=Sphingomonas baiyangensis TaxID=2572576 RepID=A0A4U1L8A3_9SPHN|nr:NAD-dependent succinate-semialdehyde dehydrogenase [Sphingomonas baiyangensis]TKD53014.1 NAD-dependent succinate-semialdehyde dehydrogenase [Sphingomonas baiyangensis]
MFQTTNPATGQPGEALPIDDEAAIEAKLAAADKAWRKWRLTPADERAALLARIADAFEHERERLARIAVCEMGKTYKSALAEVDKCAAGLRHYAEHGPAMLEPVTIATADGTPARALWRPMGPVLAIMPWNFPYWQVVRFLAPTLLGGNVGLLKHASITQGCAQAIVEMVDKAGAPAGLFQNLAVKSQAVEAILADDRIVAATLTGSEGAGAKVAEATGRLLKKVVLELGGSDPFIVMPSADLDEAAKVAAKARIQNAGQSCICAKRMIIHTDVYDAFLERFEAAMRAVTIGDPMDDVDMGPLSSFEQRDTVVDQVAKAQAEGARLLFGAEQPPMPGAYLTPGILVDVPRDAPTAQEELFGPVAMLFRAADIDDAIALANDVPFGLGSSVWTQDAGERERFERDIAAGMIAVNRMLASIPEAPFGGIKRSGHGRELGPWGLHEFLNLTAVLG